jgi:hypothetical protein
MYGNTLRSLRNSLQVYHAGHLPDKTKLAQSPFPARATGAARSHTECWRDSAASYAQWVFAVVPLNADRRSFIMLAHFMTIGHQ